MCCSYSHCVPQLQFDSKFFGDLGAFLGTIMTTIYSYSPQKMGRKRDITRRLSLGFSTTSMNISPIGTIFSKSWFIRTLRRFKDQHRHLRSVWYFREKIWDQLCPVQYWYRPTRIEVFWWKLWTVRYSIYNHYWAQVLKIIPQWHATGKNYT